MIPLGPVVARSRVRAPRAAVWATVVDPELRREWWPELNLEPRLGGAVSERWTETSGETAVSRDASGDVDVWVEGHAIGFRWSEAGDNHATAVLVTLRSQGTETGVTVTETGFDVLPSPAERAAASQDGWQVLLGDLVASVEAAMSAGYFAEEGAVSRFAEDAAPTSESDVTTDECVDGDGDPSTESDALAEDADGVNTPGSETARAETEGPEAPETEEAPTTRDLEEAEVEAEVEVEVDSATARDAEPEEPDFDTLIRGTRPN